MSNIEIDVNALSEVVNDKADRDLGNLTKAGDVKLGKGGIELCDIGMALYVDETKGLRRYLNGQIVDINTNTQAFLNRLLQIQTTNPELFTTESNWQAEALLNIDGCVYKFVLNYASDGETVVSVRLPKYPNYVEINAGGTLPVVGNGMTLGLTQGDNIYSGATSVANGDNFGARNSAYGTSVGTVNTSGNFPKAATIGITKDPTKSGIQTTLKQTKLKMRYFIQIATGSETENNIINDIELNNPYSLFDSKYSDHELNNLSWLKSEGQWNAKTAYPTAYDKLLKVYNGTETVEGLSVKLSTETYTDYDFVLNTTDETFRLPLKTLHSDDTVDSFSLYFYVGETVQNANLIDAGRIGEMVANKADISTPSIQAPYIKNTYVNGTSGYIIWSNGYCEQWGRLSETGNVTLLKAYSDTNYNISGNTYDIGTSGGWFGTQYITASSFSVTLGYAGGSVGNGKINWKTSGYLAEGEY